MKRRIKRAFSTFMVVALLLTAAPLSVFVGIDLPTCFGTTMNAKAADSRVETAINWAISIANDNSHGYIYGAKGPTDYDCSGFVCAAFKNAGFSVSSVGTSNMATVFQKAGFTLHKKENVVLQRGDILLKPGSHVELYIGDNKCVAAHDNYDNKSGDSSGREIQVRAKSACTYCNNKQYTYILRYGNSEGVVDTNYNSVNPEDYSYPTRDLFYTSPVKTGSDVAWIQAVLYQLGYSISIDGSFGPATREVVKQFQSDYGLEVDGSCGPATRSKLLELWNKKKNGNINITLHAWLSNDEYGDTPSSFTTQQRMYLCYELIESSTGQPISTFIQKEYSSYLVIYKPDGSKAHENTVHNDDDSWISIWAQQAGTWKAKVVVSGEINLEVNLSVNVEYSASFTPSVNSVSLNLNGTNEATIRCTPTGGYPGAMTVSWSFDSSVIQETNYYWDNDENVFYFKIKGLKYGSTNLVLNLHENYTSSKTKVVSFTIPVTVTANSYTISYNANGGSGAPSNQTKYHGTDITLSSTVPTKFGYTFLGWSTSSSATSATYLPGANFSGNSNTTLYAVWKAATTLSIGTTYSAGISFANKEIYYTFTPSSSGNFTFKSTGSLDSQVYIYNSSGTLIKSNDDIGDSDRNFSLSLDLTGGTKYYVKVKAYSDKTGTTSFNVTGKYTVNYNANGGSGAPSAQAKIHGTALTLSSSKPTRTGYTFTGWNTKADGTGINYSVGGSYTANTGVTLYAVWKANPVNLTVNSSNNATISTGNEMKYYTFTPGESGTYVIYSTGSVDTKVYLYNSSGTELANDDDGGDGTNFRLQYNLVEGTTYRFGVRYYNSSNTGTIPFKFGKIYTITYNANGGSGAPSSQTKDYGTALTLSSTILTRTGYTFLGWSTSSTATSATYTAGGTYSSESNATLYAVWKANTYSVKYNANGGSGTMSNSAHTYDVSKTLTSNAFTRSGYTFLGWSTNSSATTATYTNGQSVKNLNSVDGGTVNLYAVWKANSYGLFFEAKGGTGAPANLLGASSYTISNTIPTKQGYTFIGWSTSSSATTATYVPGSVITLTSDTTLYAVWKANTYSVKYNANGGSGTMSNSSHTYGVSKSLTSNGFSRTGYTFLGWSTSSSATTVTYTNSQSVKNLSSVNGDTVNLYAVWSKIPTYTISYNANGGSNAPSSQTKTKDVTLTLSSTKPTRTGYTFLGWSTSSTATTATYQAGGSITANADTALYAVWKANTYTVKYNANGGSGTMSSSSHTYDVSKALTSNAFTRSGYSFLGWSKDSSATTATYTNSQSVKNLTSVNGDTVNLYAVWHKHSYTSKVTTAATCTTAGVRTYTCSGCSDSYTETIAKLGHNYSTSYTVDTPATCTTAGSKSQHCTRCTAKQNVTVIPATGHNYVNGTCSSCGKINVTTSAAITVSSASVSAGNQVKVIISLKNNPGITSMLLSVNYDESKLQLVKVEDCENLGSAFHSNVLSSPFTLSWANDTATSNYTYNGDIVVLTFKVKDDAEVGATPITVTYEYNNYDIIDKDMNRVEFNVENGSVNISDVLIGDVNNDGNVNTLDRVILTRYIAKWAEYPAESINIVAADVNCDGSVNTLDRVILTRYIAHWGGYESLPYSI